MGLGPMTPELALQVCADTAWQATPDMALRTAIAGGLLGVAGWAGARRRFAGQTSFVVMTVVMAAWIALNITEHAAVDPGCKASVALLSWATMLAQPPLYALFLHQHVSGETRSRPLGTRWLMAVPSIGMLALAWSNGWHGLFYGDATALGPPVAGLPRLRYDYGPLFHAALALNYLWILVAALLVLRGLRAARPAQRGQWIGFLVMMTVPILANLAYLGWGVRLMGVDPTSTAFAVTVLGFAWMVRRGQMFSVVPLARRLLFSELPDPVLVLDQDLRVVDANRAAFRLAPIEPLLDTALARWPRVGPALQRHLAEPSPPALLELDDPPAWYEVQRRELGEPGRAVGVLVQLHDVSQHHRAHVEALRHLAARDAELSQASALQTLLREQALQDPLTGLLNRRALEQHHAQQVGASAGTAPEYCLVLMDLDHFKRVNDTHGHGVGDAVLRDVAATLRSGLRAGDALFRIGGEEFALLLPGAGAPLAVRRIDELRALVTASRPAGLPDPITFSAGVARAGPEPASLDSLLQAADAALYQAKRDGRNRTVLAAD